MNGVMRGFGAIIIAVSIGAPQASAQYGAVSYGVGTAGVQIQSYDQYPDVVVKTGNTTASAFRVFDSANRELLSMVATGSPYMAVNGMVRATSYTVGHAGCCGGDGTHAPGGYQFFATVSGAGQSAALQLRSGYNAGVPSSTFIGNLGTYGTYIATNREPQGGAFVDAAASPNYSKAAQIVLGDAARNRLFQLTNFLSPAPSDERVRFIVLYDGRVGIGTDAPTEMLDVQGNINVSGNINAKFQDVAEWVSASDDLQPGTVVVLNPARDNEVTASTRSYDTAVAGVVSAKPGLTLGEGSATKETVATMGRVRVRVDARRAPIAVGDLLVTSDRPGCAMKSIPVDVGGVAMHRPGTILGKALQPLPEGEGEILVLLSMQ